METPSVPLCKGEYRGIWIFQIQKARQESVKWLVYTLGVPSNRRVSSSRIIGGDASRCSELSRSNQSDPELEYALTIRRFRPH